tara:strand:+ start:11111 stop:11251 length:141 start_codon:yes stop_codon:yes gene_type:complete
VTRNQGWILILIVAIAVGWYIRDDVADWPTRAERALDAHDKLMGRD